MTSSYFSNFYKTEAKPDALPPPPVRRLRGYAFDPSLSLRLDTALINQTVFDIDWEPLEPGPVGEYVEVADYDPASGGWYEPIDLDTVEVVAQDGLAPSEGTPKFHQQMVYAVAMMTIGNFEFALGRKVFWAPHLESDMPSAAGGEYVQRLRIYPHALRAANAYYSPTKRALLFGYFRGPSGMVFSCLSHDIVAHETTHALLDGLHRRYVEDNHIDTLAFHEAFADLVALFQHFTFPEVLRHQIARTRGDLSTQTPLGELAHQFGEATGSYGALRNAIGERDENGVWHPHEPDPTRLANSTEPHARGAILVAAVFGAFRAIYRERVRDLVRLATSGTGQLPAGDIHPDLVERLAGEANKTARHFLTMCIRALDFLPPVDPTFGDFLRAMVTSDYEMVPNDPHRYRVALIESFRQWGIMPDDVRTTSEEHLRWPFANTANQAGWDAFEKVGKTLRPLISESLYFDDRRESFNEFRNAQANIHALLARSLAGDADAFERTEFERITGMNISSVDSLPGLRSSDAGQPTFEVHAVRPALRVSPDGVIKKQMIVTLTQRRKVPVDELDPSLGDFSFRAGSTLILDLEGKPSLRYAVTRRIDDEARLAQVRAYRQAKVRDASSLRSIYFAGANGPLNEAAADEPFSFLHAGV